MIYKQRSKASVHSNCRSLILAASLLLLCLSGCRAKKGLIETEGYIAVTGGKVWYKIVGSGSATPLLLLHGGPGASSRYLNSLAQLADERPVIFYDQLGGGKSDRPNDPNLWRTERFVEELAQVRQALGLDNLHILGHSWGAMLAVDYMLTEPSGIESLILASPCLSTTKWREDTHTYLEALPKETQVILSQHETAGTTDSEEYHAATMVFYKRHVCRLDPWPAAELDGPPNMDVYGTMWGPSEFYATGILKDYDRTKQLGQIAVPVLFTAGQYDEATPETTSWYQSLVPGSKIRIFEDGSHVTMMEKPVIYSIAVREFLHSVENKSDI